MYSKYVKSKYTKRLNLEIHWRPLDSGILKRFVKRLMELRPSCGIRAYELSTPGSIWRGFLPHFAYASSGTFYPFWNQLGHRTGLEPAATGIQILVLNHALKSKRVPGDVSPDPLELTTKFKSSPPHFNLNVDISNESLQSWSWCPLSETSPSSLKRPIGTSMWAWNALLVATTSFCSIESRDGSQNMSLTATQMDIMSFKVI